MKKNKQFKMDVDKIAPLVEPIGYCIASNEIVFESKQIGYMYREDFDNSDDSGWRFFSGEETQDYADNPDNFGIYDVNTIANYDRDILPYIHAPIGSEYIRNKNEFVLICDTKL